MTATVHIDAGTADAVDPFPVGAWDSARWDDVLALWSGSTPSWVEISCRVFDVATDRGRDSVLDVVTPRTSTLTVDNEDGWAGWRPDLPGQLQPGTWIRVRVVEDTVGEQILVTGRARRVVDDYVAGEGLEAEIVVIDPLSRLGLVELPARPLLGAGQTVAQRLELICDECFWPPDMRDFDPLGPTLAATDLAGNMLDLAQQAAVAGGGALFAARDGTLVYRDAEWLRTAPRSTTVQATFDTTGATGTLCAVAYRGNGQDLDRIRNVAVVGGAPPAGLPDADPLEVIRADQTSIGQYGAATWTTTGLPLDDPTQLEILAGRALGLLAHSRPYLAALEFDPTADPRAYAFAASVDLGDLIEVTYRHPNFGWEWTFRCHVHTVAHRIAPSGTNNEAAEWTVTLTLDDATFFAAADTWDTAVWDTSRWDQPV